MWGGGSGRGGGGGGGGVGGGCWLGGGEVGGGGGVGVGVRVDVNEELKFLRKFKKKNFFWGGGWGRGRVGRGQGGWDVKVELKFL